MGYDDAKAHAGRLYTGMSVGGRHDWDYTGGRWRERKLAPDEWSFTFTSPKRRRHRAPAGSGAPPGTMFHWFLLAHQRVRKIDADTYETYMEGAKWKIGHRRPHWRKWSSEYRKPLARERMIAVLEETLERLKAEQDMGASRLETLLDPSVYGLPDRRIEEWDPETIVAEEEE